MAITQAQGATNSFCAMSVNEIKVLRAISNSSKSDPKGAQFNSLPLKGKKLGFTLTEIQDLIGGKEATEATDLEDQLNPQQIVTQIGHLERQRSEIEVAIERLRATQSRLAQGVAA
jgi:hypothetical protein